MQSDIIREFLVKLGFKMDPASQRRMSEALDKMTDRVKDLAKAGAVMATAVGVAVAKVANDLDGLYFASKRIGASAGNIKAFEYAIKQMGGSGESARAALESLARFMRNSPGAESWLGGLGVKTRDAKGNLRDTVDIYADLAGVLRGMDSSQANAVAQVLGLDDVTLQAIRSGDMLKYMADYKATLKGIGLDMDQAAKNANAFEQQLTKVKTILGMLIDKYTTGLMGAPLGRIWQPEIETIKTLVGWFEKLGEGLGKIGDKLTGGKFGNWLGGAMAKLSASFGDKESLAALEANGDIDKAAPAAATGGASGDPKARAMAFFRKMGWSQEQAAGIVANLAHESGLNPGAIGDGGKAFGIAQWHPDRQANFKAWSGKDIQSSSLDEQLRFVQHELTRGAERRAGALLLAARNAQDAGSIMSRYYERPLAAEAEAAKRGATAVQLAASTTIHVHGSADPMGTAQAVASQQSRVAQDQARNFRTVLQ